MYIDCHVHTCFSGDSHTPVEEQIRRAISLGMPALCITDHQDFDFPPEAGDFTFDTEAYFKELSALKERFRGQIELLIGVELGLQTGIPTDLKAYSEAWPFDYVIGSTHVCQGMDPYFPEFYAGRSEKEAYRAYFEAELENLKSLDCFDAAGHLDYVVRYGPRKNADYRCEDYLELFDEMLKLLILRGKGLECNTGGFKAGLGHPHPTEQLLRRYRELGGELVTLGSDTHAPEHLGHSFELLKDLLSACGFRYYAVYKERKPAFYRL